MKFFAKLRDLFSKIKCKCTCSSNCIKIQVNHNENNEGTINETFEDSFKNSERQEVKDHIDHSR